MMIKIGQGIDVHSFTQGDFVMLGGVRIPHSHGIKAHSDGDVLLHALSDALLGAMPFWERWHWVILGSIFLIQMMLIKVPIARFC